MTIYATPFNAPTGEILSASVDAGFKTLAEAMQAMGLPDSTLAPAVLVYGKEPDRVLFSRVPFRIDSPGNTP